MVLDPVGGAPFAEAMKVVKWGGQIAIIGFATGTIPKVCTAVCDVMMQFVLQMASHYPLIGIALYAGLYSTEATAMPVGI